MSEQDSRIEYRVGDAERELASMPDGSAAVVALDDAWARPKRGGAFGVEYPTHGFGDGTTTLLDEIHRVLRPGGWLIADADDWLLPKLLAYLTEQWGNAAETYQNGYRKTGRVTLTAASGEPDKSTPGQYLSTGGYPVVFAHKGTTDRRTCASASQIARRPQERYGWGSVKPARPYQRWLAGLADSGEHILVPCAGTAPAAIAAERLWGPDARVTCVDIEQDARDAYRRRRRDEVETEQSDLTQVVA